MNACKIKLFIFIVNLYYCVNMASCDVALHTKQIKSTF